MDPFYHLLHDLIYLLFMPNIMPHILIEQYLLILNWSLGLFEQLKGN